MELSPRRVLLTRFLGTFWPGAYFSSFAPLQVQNLPRQTLPAHDWIRVRNRLAGICGSDLHYTYSDGDFRIAPAALAGHTPTYPGHEVVGEVIEVGEDVQRVKPGDRVVLQYGQNCVTQGLQPLCRSCAAGQYNLCEHGSFSGPGQLGGGWSEEMLLHESQVFHVPDELSDEQAVLIEPTSVALHAVLRHLPQADENVLIMGAGTIGLLALQVVRALAPQARVSMLARHAFQVEQATRLGAEHIIYPQDSYQEVQKVTGAHLYKGILGNTMLLGGYDVIYDTIGTKRTIHDALRWTRAGGSVVVIGVSLHLMRLDLTPVWYQEVNLLGSVSHGTEQWPIGTQDHYSTFAIATEMIAQGLLHPEKLITHHFALTNFREALSTAAGKPRTRAIKVVFDYALMPASVVPNVRASARLRRPVRFRAGEEPQNQQPQQVQSPAPYEPAQEESEEEKEAGTGIAVISDIDDFSNMPAGATWSQSIQPFPSSAPAGNGDTDLIPPGSDAEQPAAQSASAEHVTEETIPQHLRALTLTEAVATTYVTADQLAEPEASTEEPAPVEREESVVPATVPEELLLMEFEQPYATTEEPEPTVVFSRQREPQPILMPMPAEAAQPAPEAEEPGELEAPQAELVEEPEETQAPQAELVGEPEEPEERQTPQVETIGEPGETQAPQAEQPREARPSSPTKQGRTRAKSSTRRPVV